jgi:predicted ATPase/DNA-binding CsgD family transcriptional regulator
MQMDRSFARQPRSPLIGRREDLAKLVRLVSDPDVKLVTLTGSGGIGKTRMAIEVVNFIDEDFADGSIFVDLAPLQNSDLLPDKIASMLATAQPDHEPVSDALVDDLKEKNMLLVLDNMEHLLGGTAFVERLLNDCPDIAILVTSRERLALPNEQVFELNPLEAPDQHEPSSVETVERSDAAQLFLHHARLADRDFVLAPDNAPDIAAICRRLDGLPLAIELAASRVADIPPHLILRNFVRILPFLERSGHESDGRHRTMRNAISWSYELLPRAEQSLFDRLSIFQGAFTLDAARAVGLSRVEEDAVDATETDIALLQMLGSLVSKHLLRSVSWSGDEPRYTMLQTMREFCQEQLNASGQTGNARDAHAAYCIDLATDLHTELRGPDASSALARFNTAIEEFRAALTWLIESRTGADTSAIRLCNHLANFWLWQGHIVEGVKWYRAALAQTEDADTMEHASAYLELGHLVYDDLLESFACYQKSLSILQRLEHKAGIAGLLSCLGMASQKLGNLDEAQKYLNESLRLSQELEDNRNIANTAFHLGVLAGERENFNLAASRLELARSLWEQASDDTNAIYAIFEMGRLRRIQGQYREAEQLLRWCLARLLEAGIEHSQESIHIELGLVANALGNRALALHEFQETIVHALNTTVNDRLAIALIGVAEIAAQTDERNTAVELLSATDRWFSTSKYRRDQWEEASFQQTLERTRADLGEESFSLAWQRGALLSLEAAGKIALKLTYQAEAEPVATPAIPSHPSFDITHQERNVLCLIADGNTNRQIADQLFISVRTVAVHVQNILRKLDASNRTHASALAHLAGICVNSDDATSH